MEDGQEDSASEDATVEDSAREESPAASAPQEQAGAPKPASPSIVIGPLIIESGATPVIAVIMLVAGIIIGFLMRPEMPLPATGPAPTSQAVAQSTSPPTKPPAAASASAVVTAGPTRTPAPPTATVNPTVAAQQRKELTAFVVSNTRHFKGNANAPVTLIEFSDYQWPYCGQFATGAERQIDQTYIQQGIVRFGYVQMTFLGQESVWAAEAAECADEQGAFWAYHDYLLSHQKGENQGAFTQDNLKKFAADLRLDVQTFNTCVDSGEYRAVVEKETAFAEYLGVQSTPTFLLNGQPMGSQPFATFQRLIDAAAKQ